MHLTKSILQVLQIPRFSTWGSQSYLLVDITKSAYCQLGHMVELEFKVLETSYFKLQKLHIAISATWWSQKYKSWGHCKNCILLALSHGRAIIRSGGDTHLAQSILHTFHIASSTTLLSQGSKSLHNALGKEHSAKIANSLTIVCTL